MRVHLLLAAVFASTCLVAPAFGQVAGGQTVGEEAREPEAPLTSDSEPLPLPFVNSRAESFWWPAQKTIGASLMVLGAASLATGMAMGIIAGVKYKNLSERGCTNKQCPESVLATGDLANAQKFEYAMMGTLLGGVGAVGAGLFIHAAATMPITSRVVVRPYVGFNQVVIAGSF